MHPLYEKANELSKAVYEAALEVRRVIGNGTMLEKFKAQTLTYLKLANLPLGMVVNFGSDNFGKRGIHRVILKGATQEGQGSGPAA